MLNAAKATSRVLSAGKLVASFARMAKTIIVFGFGPGISSAVAEKFGSEGFQVAIVARNVEKLAAAEKALVAKGIKAKAFSTDLANDKSVETVVKSVHDALGPITAIHWNAYGAGAGDILATEKKELDGQLDIAVGSLIAAVRSSLPDLKSQKGDSAVLVTNGGLGTAHPAVDAMGVEWNAMGLSVANAAKNKLVGLLSVKLKPEGVYVGQVVVKGIVKGTAFDNGTSQLEASSIAGKFWDLYSAKKDVTVEIG